MILKVPDFYEDFHCIADKCKDSCCIGWELDIDEDTFEYYKSIEGPFGDRLRSHMKEGDESECNTFVLNGRRCPFLNDRNLCDIYTELGEEALCDVCTEYPRFTVEYADTVEKSLALSCEEVGRLLFTRKKPLRIVEINFEGTPEEGADEAQYVREIIFARDRAMKIMSNRDMTLHDRVESFLGYSSHVQDLINEEEEKPGRLKTGVSGNYSKLEMPTPTEADGREDFEMRMNILSGLEVLDHEWTDTVTALKEHFRHSDTYVADTLRFFRDEAIASDIAVWFELLYNYFIFRYMSKSVYDCEFYMRAKFAKLSADTIRDMAVMRWLDNKKFDLSDMIDVARIYSKEVEHSEDNLDYLSDELLFE